MACPFTKKLGQPVDSSIAFPQTIFNQYEIVCFVLNKFGKVRENWPSSLICLIFELGELFQPPFLMMSDSRDRNLTDDERLALYSHLLSKSVNSKLPYGSIKAAAEEFNFHSRTVTRTWKRWYNADDDLGAISGIRNRKKCFVGRLSIDAKIDNDALVSVPARHRQKLRHAPAATVFSISLYGAC